MFGDDNGYHFDFVKKKMYNVCEVVGIRTWRQDTTIH